jgi:hypothetical protein
MILQARCLRISPPHPAFSIFILQTKHLFHSTQA